MRKLFISIVLLLSALAVYAQTSIQVQSHKVVSIDEQFNVTFVIEGAKPTDFSWDPGTDFDLVWGPQQGRSTSVQIINGKRKGKFELEFYGPEDLENLLNALMKLKK